MARKDDADGGIRSRKMWMSVGCATTIFFGSLLAAYFPAFNANYEVFVGGQLGALAIYSGSNVGAKIANRGRPPASSGE